MPGPGGQLKKKGEIMKRWERTGFALGRGHTLLELVLGLCLSGLVGWGVCMLFTQVHGNVAGDLGLGGEAGLVRAPNLAEGARARLLHATFAARLRQASVVCVFGGALDRSQPLDFDLQPGALCAQPLTPSGLGAWLRDSKLGGGESSEPCSSSDFSLLLWDLDALGWLQPGALLQCRRMPLSPSSGSVLWKVSLRDSEGGVWMYSFFHDAAEANMAGVRSSVEGQPAGVLSMSLVFPDPGLVPGRGCGRFNYLISGVQ